MTVSARRTRALAIALTAFAVSAAGLAPVPTLAQQAAAPKSRKEKTSYVIGNNIGTGVGRSLQNDGIEIDLPAFLQGMKDALASAPPALTPDEMRDVMAGLQKEMQAKAAARESNAKTAGEKNRKEGEAFLAKNKSQPGVKTTASGLQYKVLKEGNGPVPALSDTVTVHYRGTLLNGTEFDSSLKRNEPLKIGVSSVIPGWTEVLQLIKVGSKVTVYIPGNLGYGERGAGGQIGPNALLIFDIELLDAKRE